MCKKFFSIVFIFIVISSCSNKNEIIVEDSESGFSILSYDSKVSETLSLDISKIIISDPIEFYYWSKNFQNVRNNLGNIKTSSSIKNRKQIINGNGNVSNIIQPIYFDNSLCHINSNGFLACVDVNTKEQIFEIDTKPEGIKKLEVIRGGLAYFDENIVYVDVFGQIFLINSQNGEIKWTNKIDFPILSSPLIYRDLIYFISSDNRIFAINLNDGTIKWTFQTTSENKKYVNTSSPSAFENLIIVPFSNGELIAFKYDDGRPLWSENISKVSLVSNFDIKDISANPVVNSNSVYTISTNGKLVSTNIINGERNWSVNLSGSRTPLISGNVLYIVDEDSRLICLSLDTGEIYWITQLEKFRKGNKVKDLNLWLSPVLINNLLYIFSFFGESMVISPITGEILTQEKIGVKGIISQPLILNDSVYVADENSNVFEIR